MPGLSDRARGSLLGAACGDALGVPFEGDRHVDVQDLMSWCAADHLLCAAISAAVDSPAHRPRRQRSRLGAHRDRGVPAPPDDPPTAIASAILAGGDTDTIAAMAGALAGARCGADALPEPWVARLEAGAGLRDLADRLTRLHQHG